MSTRRCWCLLQAHYRRRGKRSHASWARAALVVFPKTQRLSIRACAASAGLPEVEVANTAGECYLLYGVAVYGAALYTIQSASISYASAGSNESVLSASTVRNL